MAATTAAEDDSPQDVMDQLLRDFKCVICLEIYIDATSTDCEHVFCRFCLSKWLQFSSKCPQCHNNVNSCKSLQDTDKRIQNLFLQLPPSVHKDRDDVIQRRRKLESENMANSCTSSGMSHTQSNTAILEKLKAQRGKAHSVRTEDDWLQKITPYLTKGNTEKEEKKPLLQLPRLVMPSSSRMDMERTMSQLSASHENIKLPPIKNTQSRGHGQRQARGITTTTCAQNKNDPLTPGMEGDGFLHDTRSIAEDGIRELERRNKILEEQLFGAYDKIIDVIKESDKVVASSVDPNIFQNSRLKQSSGVGNKNNNKSQEPSFSKESMPPYNNSSGESQEQAEMNREQTNDVEDLLAETEDLIEIEDFLKKFPFERIRDDDTLINFDVPEEEDYEDEDDLNLPDSDPIINNSHDFPKTRPSINKSSRPLTAEQQEIENFYKKLEQRTQKQPQMGGSSSNGLPITPASSQKVPKSATEQTASSKMKRIPALKKFEPSSSSSRQITQIRSNTSLIEATTNNNNDTKPMKQESRLSLQDRVTTTSSAVLPKRKSILKPQPDETPITNKLLLPNKLSVSDLKKTTTTVITDNNNSNNKRQKFGQQSSSNRALKPSKQNNSKGLVIPKAPADPSLGSLSYDDFLKLEIDFLDGEGDWKDFEKPAPPPLSKKSAQNMNRAPANNKDSTHMLDALLRTPTTTGPTTTTEEPGRVKNMHQNPVGISSTGGETKKSLTRLRKQ